MKTVNPDIKDIDRYHLEHALTKAIILGLHDSAMIMSKVLDWVIPWVDSTPYVQTQDLKSDPFSVKKKESWPLFMHPCMFMSHGEKSILSLDFLYDPEYTLHQGAFAAT